MWWKKIPVTLSRAGNLSVRFCTIVSNSKERDVRFKKSILSELVSKYGNEQIIQEALKRSPELEQSDLHLWNCFTSAMHAIGFKFEDILEIITLSPQVLSITQENIKQVMNRWEYHTQMDKKKLKLLLVSEPDFLNLKPTEIQRRVSFLKAYASTPELLLSLLLLCPNVMFEKWSEVEKKINFLDYEMMVYRPEILQCKALSKSLDHIKMRFFILERCGLYIKPHQVHYKQTKAEILKLNNPKLSHITDRSDTSFAKRVAKITLEEYQVFTEMYAFEQNQLSDSDDSDEECD